MHCPPPTFLMKKSIDYEIPMVLFSVLIIFKDDSHHMLSFVQTQLITHNGGSSISRHVILQQIYS